jgi:hypothetical protein
MSRLLASLAASILATLALAAPAGAAAGFESFDVTFEGSDGLGSMQAGSHPLSMTTAMSVAQEETPTGGVFPLEAIRNARFGQVPGLSGIPSAAPPCATLDFLTLVPGVNNVPQCAPGAAIGTVRVVVGTDGGEDGGENHLHSPVYNLEAAPRTAAKVGFWVQNVPVTVDLGLSESPPYNVVATLTNVSQILEFLGGELTLWGVPADPAHDQERGFCFASSADDSCSAAIPRAAFLVLPRACEGPLTTTWATESWQGVAGAGDTLTHDDSGNAEGMANCDKLRFEPRIEAAPTNRSAESPSGLDFDLDIHDEGIANPDGIAFSDTKKAVVTLPQGMTLNPSQAAGLATCSEQQLALETADSPLGAGCPQASKVGTVEVQTPTFPEKVFKGELFVATPYENRFGTLIAVFMTVKDPGLGIAIKLAGKVEPDPRTGQLVTTFDDLPQQPFSHFHLHFREGGRSPLVTPPACGSYTVDALFTPWASPGAPYPTSSSFQIVSGPAGGPCPPAGPPPFDPGFSAGTLNSSAASYSPFHMKLTRNDGDQDITRFSSVLPPGLLAKLAGVSRCPDAAIDAARAKTGRQEIASSSCPSSSQIGRLTVGAGVGSQLTYVGGKLYLAGPYRGAPLSIAVITPAVAGPFDVGTVLVRVGVRVNPVTAEAEVDGAASDPIPHILQGIVLKVRDVRVDVDRSSFVLNPTSCAISSVKARIWGGGTDPFSSDDDSPASMADRFQASDCAALGFRPHLELGLKGGTRRGDHPALRATYRPRGGDANLRSLSLLFPRSAFVENANFRTICTRVQFAADACPKGAIYGHVRAFTPLLDEPLSGPVYLRSSDHLLPDAVFVLHSSIVDAEVAVRIDSSHGRLRATVANAPDVPVTKVTVKMRGGNKGLFVNSRFLCSGKSRATVQGRAQNGRSRNLSPLMRALTCRKGDTR